MGVVARAAAAGALSLVMVAPEIARAGGEYRGLAALSVGTTDDAVAGADGTLPLPDVFLLLRAGGDLVRRGALSSQRLAGQLAAGFYSGQAEINSLLALLRAYNTTALGSTAELRLQASASYGHVPGNTLLLTPDEVSTVARVPGATNLASARVREQIVLSTGAAWRASQSLGATAFRPIGSAGPPPPGETIEPALAVEHRLHRLDLLAEARGIWGRRHGYPVPGWSPVSARTVHVAEGTGGGRHELTPTWGFEAQGGATFADLASPGGGVVTPGGRVEVWHHTEITPTELVYRRTIEPNVLLGEVLLVNDVSARGAWFVDQGRRVALRGSAGFQQARVLFAPRVPTQSLQIWRADVSAAWRIRPALEVSARVQVTDQEALPVPSLALMSFRQTTFVVTVAAVHPVTPLLEPLIP